MLSTNIQLIKELMDNITHPCALLNRGEVICVNNILRLIIEQREQGSFELKKQSILKFQYLNSDDKVDLFGKTYELKVESYGDHCIIIFQDKIDNYLDELLLAIGHEIKTPLTIIQAGLEQSKVEQIIKDIVTKSIERISSLSNDLTQLELVNWANLKNQKIELDQIAIEVKNTYEKIASYYGINLIIENIGKKDTILKGGASVLRKVLNPLIDNSINSFEKLIKKEKTIRLVFNFTSKSNEFIIEDTGEGIKDENLENVFRPFFKESKERQGESKGGLGLPIVKRILNRINGKISISSTKGIGTRVKVEF